MDKTNSKENQKLKIIVGHSNMDLDSIASMVLAKYIYTDHICIKSHLVHPVARKLMNLYEDRLGFVSAAELKGRQVEQAVVVDTRSSDRVEEYFRGGTNYESIKFIVYDHHPSCGKDLDAVQIHEKKYGANASQLGMEIIKRGIFLEPEDATIALAGIYADTGNFIHENVVQEDFDVASFLLASGASLKLVKDFLIPLQDKKQQLLFHEAFNNIKQASINGNDIHYCYMELDLEAQGLGAIIEQLFKINSYDALLGFFAFRDKGKLLVIGRSSLPQLNLSELLSAFGGGGHKNAASTTLKTGNPEAVKDSIFAYMEILLEPAYKAVDLMDTDIACIDENKSLLEASVLLENISQTGVPVLDASNKVSGFLTLRDIMKGRKADQMNSPIKNFMSKPVVFIGPNVTIKEVEAIIFEKNIGHLPVIDKDKLLGIINRNCILKYKREETIKRKVLTGEEGLWISGPI